jgi:hypothetical protein
MRAFVYWSVAAAVLFSARPAFAATYSTDKSYQFTGQTNFNSGNGVAVNAADTRLYVIVSGPTGGGVRIMDTATGTEVGAVTPPSPTNIRDIAISPDGATLYFLRDTDSAWTLESVSAADGPHAPEDVTPIAADPATEPESLAIAQSGGDLYIGVAGKTNLFIYKRPAGGSWALDKTVNLPPTSAPRDIAAADTGSGMAFYILTPGGGQAPSVQVYNLDGTLRTLTFAPLPAAFTDYNFDSITTGGLVDGEQSLYIAADTVDFDHDFNSVLSVFRYTTGGAYTGDGFGFALSPTAPLNDLRPLGQDTLLAPGAVTGDHFYIGAINPAQFNGEAQTTRVVISADTGGPGSISGTVKSAEGNLDGAQVMLAGRDAPFAATAGGGAYTLTPLNAGAYIVSASKFGFVAAQTSVSLAAGEVKTGVNITLPGTVPTFNLGPSFAPPISDGQIFPGEYNSPPMPLYRVGGGEADPAVAATAWVTHDDQNLYVAVSAGEPSLSLDSAAWSNQNMLVFDDTTQIYVDPPHRHDAGGSQNNLFQFAANIPPVIGGQPNGTPQRLQRRIHPDGSFAQSVDSSVWFARVGYTATGWNLEARISLDAFAPFEAPDANAVWGLLIGRNRPDSHNDSLPTLYSTSPAQTGGLTHANTWTDVTFEPPAAGVKGDVNENGRVDVADAVYVLRMAAGLSFGTPNPDDEYGGDPNAAIRAAVYARGNVWPAGTPDAHITLEDAIRVLRAATGTGTL